MARDGQSRQPRSDENQILEQFQKAISGLGQGELHRRLQDLLAAGTNGLDPFERPRPPSRRRPPRSDVVTYQVRVNLAGTKPPLWRRLELASDLHLDQVHDIMQIAFGWTDSHLHKFGCGGPHPFSDETEDYLSPWEIEDGGVGVPEGEVRLDEVLVDAGDKLFYSYDYGDGWEHVVKLEAVRPRDERAPRAICTTGRRPGPAEDCGGVGGYELI
ncbi:MAG TPA: plasmid pRiA4b ORF-3 family protein, partial [Actinopolymorphaceae bacterium]|nr:plasmid pRiA4b ORF-3 family protein [Actinopolymorphaceae bacterium]